MQPRLFKLLCLSDFGCKIGIIKMHISRLLCKLSELIHIGCLEQCLTHCKHSILAIASYYLFSSKYGYYKTQMNPECLFVLFSLLCCKWIGCGLRHPQLFLRLFGILYNLKTILDIMLILWLECQNKESWNESWLNNLSLFLIVSL